LVKKTKIRVVLQEQSLRRITGYGFKYADRLSRGGAVIIFQESAEAFPAFDFAVGTADCCLWKWDAVVQTLMIALRLII
jgi:hypothetical protein